ncbi:hypothetical protein QR680_006334 [Steinernema hermaphroditum]|uniref:G-protein coupled receptors family 1 profile domain-containing protein n=1 Tax=Steinernema hermaphroditum TaxID=289476 RepID=A0AA39LWD4_9BILA|nr:hypothetical protein QR680_006334 [Steinernema hermaphroditum]
MSNATAPLEVRLIGGIVTSLAASIGLLGNVVFIFVSIKNFASFRKSPFFLITWQMNAGDLMVILAQLIVAVPDIFAGYDVFHGSSFPIIMGLLDGIGYMSNLFFALVLIFNRFLIFCCPPVNGVLFGKRAVLITIAVMWTYIIGRSLYVNLAGCTKVFDLKGFFFRHSCQGAAQAARDMNTWAKYESYGFPVLMFVLYIVVLIKIHFDWRLKVGNTTVHTQTRKAKVERRLLIQSILICGMLQVEAISFVILPKIRLQPPGHYYMSFLSGLIVIANSSTHPLVLFVFNSDVRQGLKNLFRNGTPVQNLSVSISASVKKRSTQTIAQECSTRRPP